MSSFEIQCVSNISEIGQSSWNALMGTDNPFTRYEFLYGLESSQCVGAASGWQPMHLQVKQSGQYVALMPLYLKGHSFGEYVFDWAWAQAYERHELAYYPKLVNAVPFSPISGCRLAIAPQLSRMLHKPLLSAISTYLGRLLQTLPASGWHSLFLSSRERALWQRQGHISRLGTQFHWRNRDYISFDDFLAAMTSRKRKSILKERRCLADKGLSFKFIHGTEINEAQLDHLLRCYQQTYLKRSGHSGYLNRAFFASLLRSMPHSMRLLMVERGDGGTGLQPIAAALYFVSSNTLYGRYWGCLEEIEGLHFEACYYQGIEYAIALGLRVFDAGAQGEHKVLRGFEPVETHSVHEIAHPDFRRAIADFARQERQDIQRYMAQLGEVLPFKRC